MKRTVTLTQDAEQDLEAVYHHVLSNAGSQNANTLLEEFMALVGSLNVLSKRGNHPKELANLGIKEYRQVFLHHYRVIYRVISNEVVIYLIADGRRDFQTLLAQRLLRV